MHIGPGYRFASGQLVPHRKRVAWAATNVEDFARGALDLLGCLPKRAYKVVDE
jgi:hypothetical protein